MNNGPSLDIIQILIESSIVVKLDLLILILASVYSWGIIFKKINFFRLTSKKNDNFLKFFNGSTSLLAVEEKSREMEDSPYLSLFNAGYGEFLELKDANENDMFKLRKHFSDFGMTSLERSLNGSLTKSEEEAGDSLTTLASIGAISPFIGLFGTVWGIIDSFSNIASGGASLESVAPGIAEALVATAAGLVAAIPATWYYNKFGSRKAKLRESLITFSEKFINEIEKVLAKRTHG